MRVTIIKSLITGIIPVLFSCQDSIINGEYSTSNESADTRTEQIISKDYYWFKGEKMYIERVESKSFILFKTKDEDKVLSSLSKAKIRYNISNIHN